MWRFERMFISNVCRIIVETTLGPCRTIWNWNQWLTKAVLQGCPTAFAGSMQDLQVSHRGSHRTIGRLTFECWVFLTVEYRIPLALFFGDLGKIRTPLCSFDKLIFGAPFYSHIVWDIAMPKCQILCSSIVWSFSATWIWKRWISGTDGTVCWWPCHMNHVGPTRLTNWIHTGYSHPWIQYGSQF